MLTDSTSRASMIKDSCLSQTTYGEQSIWRMNCRLGCCWQRLKNAWAVAWPKREAFYIYSRSFCAYSWAALLTVRWGAQTHIFRMARPQNKRPPKSFISKTKRRTENPKIFENPQNTWSPVRPSKTVFIGPPSRFLLWPIPCKTLTYFHRHESAGISMLINVRL